MPKRKTTTTTSNKSGIARTDTKQEILALVYWNHSLKTWELCGVTDCSPSYKKLVSSIAWFYTADEEIAARMRCGYEVLAIRVIITNHQIERCEQIIKKMNSELLNHYKDGVQQLALTDRINEMKQHQV
ncbi:MAG: hypothetical protein KME30_29080 [Iphinoe sp. HA4291-MV1]|jgi:allophanate hydrolase subunit 1|nr:hypothetical protein [Iphinoe sp. HA4291-MV1]